MVDDTPQEPENLELSQADVEALRRDPTAETKVRIVEKLSKQYTGKKFSDAQLHKAEEIFRKFLKDTEVEVRKALSESIVSSSMVPKDVVISLAKDIEIVACPILEFSEVFSEEDLIEIVEETDSTAHQSAIASRTDVSEKLSEALIETSAEEVVDTLLHNETAVIKEESYDKVIENFAESEKVVESLVTRGAVADKIVQKMATTISHTMKERLEKKYQASFTEIHSFFQDTGEMAAIKLMGKQEIEEEFMALVETLDKEDKLGDALKQADPHITLPLENIMRQGNSIVISILSLGHLPLFEAVLTRLAGVPYNNVRKLISDTKGLHAVYERAHLPEKMFEVVDLAVSVIIEIEEGDELEPGETLRDNLHIFIKHITNAAHGRKIRNLSHFISIIKENIEKRQEGW